MDAARASALTTRVLHLAPTRRWRVADIRHPDRDETPILRYTPTRMTEAELPREIAALIK